MYLFVCCVVAGIVGCSCCYCILLLLLFILFLLQFAGYYLLIFSVVCLPFRFRYESKRQQKLKLLYRFLLLLCCMMILFTVIIFTITLIFIYLFILDVLYNISFCSFWFVFVLFLCFGLYLLNLCYFYAGHMDYTPCLPIIYFIYLNWSSRVTRVLFHVDVYVVCASECVECGVCSILNGSILLTNRNCFTNWTF